MRRFIAYSLASLTMFLGIGASFKPIATRINADLNYRNGKQIIFKLSEREEGGVALDDDSAKNYAAIMDSRLKYYGADDYKIVTQGNDTISVTLTANNEDEYNNISKMLTISSRIELSRVQKEDTFVTDKEGEWSWHDKEAYITFDGNTSVLVMPIPDKAKQEVKELYKKAEEDDKEKKTNDEPKEKKVTIALWLNRLEDDKYADKDKFDNVKQKIIHEFKTADFYYGTDESAFSIRFTPTSNNKTQIENKYKEALFYKTMLNTCTTNYDCRVLNSQIVNAGVEQLLIYGDQVKIAASASLIGLFVGLALISIILAIFYRLGAIAIVATLSSHTFITFLIFVLLRPLFNVAAYVGVIVVSLASLFIGIAYNAYIHEECYKGRNLKKANYEASKKTTMLAVDVSILFILTGVLTYFIGGASIASLGVMLIIGGIINIFINTFLLKGLMWLLTNSTYFQHHLKALNINAKKIPNLANEEKQTYYGPFIDKKVNVKQKRIFAGVFALLILASSIGMIAFASLKGTMFNSSSFYKSSNEIHLVSPDYSTEGATDPITDYDDFKTKVLDTIKNNDKKLDYNSNINSFSYVTKKKKEGEIDKLNYYYIITINESDVNTITYSYNNGEKKTLEEAFSEALTATQYNIFSNKYSMKSNVRYNFNSNEAMIFLASVVSLASMTIYMFIRYRASRVISVFIFTVASTVLTMGYLTLTRLSVSPVMGIATILTATISLMIGLFILNKDKDLMRDERGKDFAIRKDVLQKALAMGLVPASIFSIIGAVIGVNYFAISPRIFSTLYISSAFSVLCIYILYVTLFTSCANFFESRFMRINMPKITLKKHKTIVKKSNEPTEAIFFGIND